MATETPPAATTPEPDRYFELVRAFPLRPIRSAESTTGPSPRSCADDRRSELQTEERDYFLVLGLLLERYEDEIYGTGLEPVESER